MAEPTVDDWIERARSATNLDDVTWALDAAAMLASDEREWRVVLSAAVELQGIPDAAISTYADETLAVSLAERSVWGCRDVAAARATRLGDPEGARAALEACEARLGSANVAPEERGSPAVRGYEWGLLADGFVAVLEDGAAALRVLERALSDARKARATADLVSLATALANHGTREHGAAVLAEAEALAAAGGPDDPSPWALANAWFSVGNAGAARRVLEQALSRASKTADALHVAQAWASHHETKEAERARRRAKKLASSADDWLAVAEVAHDARLGEAEVREALEKAEALATTPAQRSRVAAAFAWRLGDSAAAARVGPRGAPPDALRARVRRLPFATSSASALFDWLRARMGAERLERIARADYGMDAHKHLAALRDICATGVLPRELPWEPHEVLALSRWAEGERVDHIERAFCALVLCLAPGGLDDFVTNGAILAESAIELAGDACAHSEAYFAWYAETEPLGNEAERVERAVAPSPVASPERSGAVGLGVDEALALLLVAIVRAARGAEVESIERVAHLLLAEDASTLAEMADLISGSMRASVWSRLLERHLAPLRESEAIGELVDALSR